MQSNGMVGSETALLGSRDMKLMRLIAITAAIFLAASAARPAPAVAGPMQWGDAVSGVRLGIAIESTGQSEFHPGEYLRLSVKVQPERKILLPGDLANNLDYYLVVHIVTPDGHKAVWDPGFGMAVQGNAHHAQDWYKTAESASASPRLRLARGHTPWFGATSDQPVLSLRAPGKYRMWLEFRVSPDAEAPRAPGATPPKAAKSNGMSPTCLPRSGCSP